MVSGVPRIPSRGAGIPGLFPVDHQGGAAVRGLAAALVLSLAASPALAHDVEGAGGFLAGLAHPVFGLDHVVAMVAVGLWGAFLGAPAIVLLPVVFPLVMAFGGVLGILGLPLPATETGIAASAIVLGLMVALAARPPVWVAALLVGAFAIFHGYAHGRELPDDANAVAFAAGFVIATGLLHLTGIAFGLLTRWPAGRVAVRAAGAGIALVGVGYLGGLL
ncbi:MAG: HupE/UreJ family protein [Alphaproteobacteria bacterium]|nr:HupE/UreJ family protein [Alphaproteobacteria bacterium]